MSDKFRVLQFDPTPAGLIVSLRKEYKSVWQTLRKKVLKEFGLICHICGNVGKISSEIDCHEVYSYPCPIEVRLERIIPLCKICHQATHFERSKVQCGANRTQQIINHYCKLNSLNSKSEFDRDFEKSFQKMIELRKFYGGPSARPHLDFGFYTKFVDQYEARRKERMEHLYEESDGNVEMLPDHECFWDTSMWRDSFSL